MIKTITLNSFDFTYPDNQGLVPCNGIDTLTILDVKSNNGAVGQILLSYTNRTFQSFQITELTSINIDFKCIGFSFLAPDLADNQQLEFTFRLLLD